MSIRKKIKGGARRKCRPRNHLNRFEDFSPPSKGREICRRPNLYRARFVTVRFTRKAQHLSSPFHKLPSHKCVEWHTADSVMQRWKVSANRRALCNAHVTIKRAKCDSPAFGPLRLYNKAEAMQHQIMWANYLMWYGSTTWLNVSHQLLYSIRIQRYSSKTFTWKRIAVPTGATLCIRVPTLGHLGSATIRGLIT